MPNYTKQNAWVQTVNGEQEMFPPIRIALSGLTAASTRMEVAASNIANVNTGREYGFNDALTNLSSNQAYSPKKTYSTPNSYGGVDVQIIDSAKGSEVSLAQEIVNFKIAEHAYKANATVIKLAADVQDELLDIV